jgi:hypothetical protein
MRTSYQLRRSIRVLVAVGLAAIPLGLAAFPAAAQDAAAPSSATQTSAPRPSQGYRPYFVEGHDPAAVHQQLAGVLDAAVGEIRRIWDDARSNGVATRPAWPMIVFRTPKGWTCPPEIDGKKCEDYWRSHQVPMGDMDKPDHIKILEQWMKSYKPEELFDAQGKLTRFTDKWGGHWMALDEQGKFSRSNLKPLERITSDGAKPTLIVADGGAPIAVSGDRLYYGLALLDGNHVAVGVTRISTDGQQSVFNPT